MFSFHNSKKTTMEKDSGKGPSSSISTTTNTTINTNPFRCRTSIPPHNETDCGNQKHLLKNADNSVLPSSTLTSSYQQPLQSSLSAENQSIEIKNIDSITNDINKLNLAVVDNKINSLIESTNRTKKEMAKDDESTVDDGGGSCSSGAENSNSSSKSTVDSTSNNSSKNFLSMLNPTPQPKYNRNHLPKTQSLDLVDERTDDGVILISSNKSSVQTRSSGGSLTSSSEIESSEKGISGEAGAEVAVPKFDQPSRPIYPNVPYSPYGSPYGSPRSGRRRPPLRESRRISIEQTGSFLQLNQYKLMDQIGQVINFSITINFCC